MLLVIAMRVTHIELMLRFNNMWGMRYEAKQILVEMDIAAVQNSLMYHRAISLQIYCHDVCFMWNSVMSANFPIHQASFIFSVFTDLYKEN
jgi:hypothetical protein